VAGAGGFEPPHGGTKIRCLTAWLRPNRNEPCARIIWSFGGAQGLARSSNAAKDISRLAANTAACVLARRRVKARSPRLIAAPFRAPSTPASKPFKRPFGAARRATRPSPSTRGVTSPAASFFQPARRFWIARGPARAVRYPCARHRGGCGLGDPALYFACRDNYQSPRWGVASYLRPVGSAFLCPLGSALPKRHLAGGSNGWSPTALRSAVRPFPPGLGSPPEPLVQEQETPPSPIGRNRNEPKRERQGARCGWVPCLPNFLPGYQGGASWRGAFLASVTTDSSGRIPGPRPMARRVLSVQTRQPVNAEVGCWFPTNLPFFRAVDA
jgi:hypothetical protein